ncbi:hypothetical protein HK101_001907 [Irineochytrium annulatum]|nr:hypothetical protein HK101_001907 [Irineochytrium annulatum]
MVSVDRITHGAPVANLIAKVLTVAPIEDPAPTDAEPDGDAAGKPPPKRERRSSTAPASAPVRARPRLMQAELVDPTGRITLVCPQSLATIVKPGRMVQVFGRTNCYAGRLQVQGVQLLIDTAA